MPYKYPTYEEYDNANYNFDIDELNKKEEVVETTDANGFDDYVIETSILDTETMQVVEVIVDVELLDPDHNEQDPEYDRVLGMYAEEYSTEINMVDAIDTESDFDADEINGRTFESPSNW